MKITDHFGNRPDETALELKQHTVCGAAAMEMVLNEEHELKLFHENQLLHTFVCSPGELGELCAGWIFSEGFSAEEVEVAEDGKTASVKGNFKKETVPHGGGSAEKVPADAAEMLELFAEASDKYSRSHGIHECVIKGEGWYVIRTDIGRHNAIDKAIGSALKNGRDLRGAVLFTSGRINEQTVRKAVRCGIGCLMSKAVITHQALLLAEELGLKVFFSVKKDSYMTI